MEKELQLEKLEEMEERISRKIQAMSEEIEAEKEEEILSEATNEDEESVDDDVCREEASQQKEETPHEVNVSSDDYDLTSAAICFGLGVGAGLVLSKVTRSLFC